MHRELPHFDKKYLIQSVTTRLYDSIPKLKIIYLQERLKPLNQNERKIELARQLEAFLDKGEGQQFMMNHDVAKIVEDQLLEIFISDGLIAWVIMPNHVHFITARRLSTSLKELIKRWKGISAYKCNILLKRHGYFWAKNYFDRFIRDEEHLNRCVQYINYNPVKAGLVRNPSEYPFCSAARRDFNPFKIHLLTFAFIVKQSLTFLLFEVLYM